MGNRPLRDQYPSLYNIARRKQDTVAEVLGTNPPNISWRRDLVGNKLVMWNNLLPRVANIVLSHDEDEFRWNLHQNGEFSVILTKDNLVKRNWRGSRQCCFCHKDETIQHLFFDCQLARMIWAVIYAAFGISQPRSVPNMFGTWLTGINHNLKHLVLLGAAATCWSLWLCKNGVIFENKQYSFLQVIFSITHWLRTWAILQKPTTQDSVVAASQCLAQMAKDFFTRAHGWRSSLRIESH